MSISRRKFLKAGTIVAVSAAIPMNVLATNSAGPLAQILPSLSSSPLGSSMDSALFSRYVNTQFILKRGGTQAKLTLREVRHWNSRGSKKSLSKRECFSLVFENAGQERLSQNTYSAAHSALGEFSLFVVPMGKTQNKYEALFNRLHG